MINCFFIQRDDKRVNFNTCIKIILIPDREFISSNNLTKYLWWDNDDLKMFRKESILEVKTLIDRNPSMKINDAFKLLYQPNNITFNEENFY